MPELEVEIRFVEYLDRPPQEVWVFDFGEAEADEGAASAIVLAALRDTEEIPPSYAFDRRESIMSWGAAGFFEKLLLEVEQNAIALAVGAALGGSFRKILTVLRHRGTAEYPVTRDEAEQRARWLVVERFALPCQPEQLELRSEAEAFDSSGWSFTFGHEDVAYDVNLVERDGYATFTRIRRSV